MMIHFKNYLLARAQIFEVLEVFRIALFDISTNPPA